MFKNILSKDSETVSTWAWWAGRRGSGALEHTSESWRHTAASAPPWARGSARSSCM